MKQNERYVMIVVWGSMCLLASSRLMASLLRKISTKLVQVVIKLMSAEGMISLHCLLSLGKSSPMIWITVSLMKGRKVGEMFSS